MTNLNKYEQHVLSSLNYFRVAIGEGTLNRQEEEIVDRCSEEFFDRFQILGQAAYQSLQEYIESYEDAQNLHQRFLRSNGRKGEVYIEDMSTLSKLGRMLRHYGQYSPQEPISLPTDLTESDLEAIENVYIGFAEGVALLKHMDEKNKANPDQIRINEVSSITERLHYVRRFLVKLNLVK